MSANKTILTELKTRYIRIRVIETLFLSIAVSLVLYGGFYFLNTNSTSRIVFSACAGIAVFIFRFFQLNLHRITEKSVAAFLNLRYAELSAGADLILASEDSLSVLARIQRNQTSKNLESLSIQFPNRLKTFSLLAVFGAGIMTIVLLSDFRIQQKITSDQFNENSIDTTSITENLPSEIKEAKINISPPAYTGLKNYGATDLNLSIPENSRVAWTLKFSQTVKRAGIIISSQDTAWFTSNNTDWRFNSTLDRSGFYHLVWKDETTHASAYYKIEIKKDQPPVIELTNLNQFTQVSFDSKKIINTNPTLSDDYGLSDAYIIATVSKGSGESVKFREEKIKFSDAVTGKQVKTKQSLDLTKLGMEPGDELYFYVEALDNKSPLPNRTRTETYFITIPDTAQDVMVADGGLGVDLMPEYFRSQRQIIIDTEKLIRERKTISKQEFNSRSNELGYDQKVLRLRYGQFLGEEDESAAAPAEDHHEDDHDGNEKPEDIIKEFGHQHDTENEHNLVEEKDPTKRGVDGGKMEDLLAGFGHEHDTEESATFFFQSLKLKLKAALAQMWDAELYLRLYEPEKSLPYQYTALKLLKEISNDSRIYVHRTGFEPPPIKEEKRLSAELNDVLNSSHAYRQESNIRFPKLAEALPITEKLLCSRSTSLSQREKNILLQSGNELAQAALENPALLEGLSALQKITDSDKIDTATLRTLRKSYWLALPEKPRPAGKTNSMLHELDNQLIKQLEVPEQ